MRNWRRHGRKMVSQRKWNQKNEAVLSSLLLLSTCIPPPSFTTYPPLSFTTYPSTALPLQLRLCAMVSPQSDLKEMFFDMWGDEKWWRQILYLTFERQLIVEIINHPAEDLAECWRGTLRSCIPVRNQRNFHFHRSFMEFQCLSLTSMNPGMSCTITTSRLSCCSPLFLQMFPTTSRDNTSMAAPTHAAATSRSPAAPRGAVWSAAFSWLTPAWTAGWGGGWGRSRWDISEDERNRDVSEAGWGVTSWTYERLHTFQTEEEESIISFEEVSAL